MDSRNENSMLQAALDHASQGKPVFPCGKNKQPLTLHGFKDATTDPLIIRQHWTRNAEALISTPTGATTGVFILDVDLPEGPATLAGLELKYGPLPATLEQSTGSGGRHLIFKHPGATVKNSAGKIGPGLDIRGDGGYIVLAPSPGYAWSNSFAVAEAPAWLLETVTERQKEAVPVVSGSPYGMKAFQSEIADLKTAKQGSRNARLNAAAFSLAQLVAGGELDHEQVEKALLSTALEIGLSLSEARATIASGMVAGRKEPRAPIATPAPAPYLPLQGEFGARLSAKTFFVDGNSLNEALPRVDYIIKGIIESNATCMLFGPSGGAKTFNALDMALCCATGKPWNGRVTKQGIVIYFCGEGQSGISRRIKAWSEVNGHPDLSNFHVSKQPVNLEVDMQTIISEIQSYTSLTNSVVVLLIIDTLSRHLNGLDENSSRDCMKFMNMLNPLMESFTGSSVLIVHHTGVDTEQVHRARGSSALKAACDSEISCNKGQLTCTKMKDGEMFKPIVFKLKTVVLGADEDGEQINSCVVVHGEKDETNMAERFTRYEGMAIHALVDVCIKENRLVDCKYVAKSELWREQFYNLRKNEDAALKQEALKKSFQNAVKGLITKKAVTQMNIDSMLLLTDKQDSIRGAILAQSLRVQGRETGNLGNFPGTFPAG